MQFRINYICNLGCFYSFVIEEKGVRASRPEKLYRPGLGWDGLIALMHDGIIKIAVI